MTLKPNEARFEIKRENGKKSGNRAGWTNRRKGRR